MTDPGSHADPRPRRSPRRRAAALLAATLLASFGFMLGTARPVAACSCAMPTSLAEQATAETAIFAGTADVLQARGVPVAVERWFWGAGAAPIVWLTADSFGDSAACGTNVPPPGSRWIWVTWLPGNAGDFGTGLCSPSGNLDTPEGQAVFDEAIRTFVGAPIPSAETDPTSAPVEAPAPAPAADRTGLLVGGAIAIASLILFGGIVLAARRRAA